MVRGRAMFLQNGRVAKTQKTIAAIGMAMLSLVTVRGFAQSDGAISKFDEVVYSENTMVHLGMNPSLFRTNGGVMEVMHVNLYGVMPDNSTYPIDGAIINCHETYSLGYVPAEDGLKIMNFTESLFIPEGGVNMDIDGRPLFDNGDTLRIGLAAMKSQNYQLQIVPISINATAVTAILHDTYLNTAASVSLSTLSVINFAVNSNPASKSATRFYMSFGAAALPVDTNSSTQVDTIIVTQPPAPVVLQFVGIQATKVGNAAHVAWQVSGEDSIVHYDLQNSTNGTTFTTLSSSSATNAGSYMAVESNVGNPNNLYYRIKAVANNSTIYYSPVVKLAKKQNAKMTTYPNPALGNNLNLNLQDLDEGTYTISVYNLTGKQVLKQQVSNINGIINVSLPQGMDIGMYDVHLEDKTGNILLTNRLMKQ